MDAVIAVLPAQVRAITLDLDETLWPVWPAIQRAEQAVHAWLTAHAPATAAAFDRAALRRLREEVGLAHPEYGHDLSWLRRRSLALALGRSGDDPALAEPALAHFMEHRQRVDLFPDVHTALPALARRFPILALTNGNADLQRIGLAQHFVGTLSAREHGLGKPEVAFFHAGCARLGLAPEQVLHVGDDWALDIEGAHDAGQPSVWLHRPGHPGKPPDSRARPWRELSTLDELVATLA
jgi:FMN hydrolase / 5-amino-6-(5-phospho-D-ribitylamino)uracil phosphatase